MNDAAIKTLNTMLLHTDRCEAYHSGQIQEMMLKGVDDNVVRLKIETNRLKYIEQLKSLTNSLHALLAICGDNLWADGELGLWGKSYMTVGLVFHRDDRENEYSWGTWSCNS